MKEINIKQNTPEWHEYRALHVGASEVPAILNMSPYKKAEDIWREKTGTSQKDPPNEAMLRGIELEPKIRQMVCERVGIEFIPKVFEHSNGWLSASLDGINQFCTKAIEIKTCGARDQEQARLSIVPLKYFGQIQTQMYICDLSEMLYCSYHEGELIMFPVLRDQRFIDDMLPKLEEFWESVQNFIAPDEIHKVIEDREWNQLAMDWRDCQEDKKNVLTREESLKSMLISHAGNKNAKGYGLKISKHSRKGSPDLFAIAEDYGIDIEDYRKPSTEYWRIIDETT